MMNGQFEPGVHPHTALLIIFGFLGTVLMFIICLIEIFVLSIIPWLAIGTMLMLFFATRRLIKEEERRLGELNYINGIG